MFRQGGTYAGSVKGLETPGTDFATSCSSSSFLGRQLHDERNVVREREAVMCNQKNKILRVPVVYCRAKSLTKAGFEPAPMKTTELRRGYP